MAESTVLNPTLTQDQVQRILIEPLMQASTYLRQGFPIFSSSGEPIKVPSLSTFGTATYVTQGSAIPEVSASTSEVVFLPATVYALKAITRVSNELVRQAVVNVESAFSMKIVADISRLLDAAMWNGTGTGGQPLGMARFAGVTSTGTAAGTVTAAKLYDMQEAAQTAYVEFNATTWAMSPKNFRRIQAMQDLYGRNLLAPSLSQAAPATLLGQPYVVTTHLPDTTILLFDRSQVAVGYDTRAAITLLDQTYADTDEIGIRVVARYDTAALNPSAVVKLSGITA